MFGGRALPSAVQPPHVTRAFSVSLSLILLVLPVSFAPSPVVCPLAGACPPIPLISISTPRMLF